MKNKFEIKNKSVIVTGGTGLLGIMHAEAIAEIGGVPVLFDRDSKNAKKIIKKIEEKYLIKSHFFKGDVTKEKDIRSLMKFMLKKKLKIYGLINNAASNPPINKKKDNSLDIFSLKEWNIDLNVGLTGAFLCCKIIGEKMSKNNKGVIINISSDLGLVSPEHRLYKQKDKIKQFKKPITYSVVKHGIIGLTKYLATYWTKNNVRANCLCPGGVYDNQEKKFINKVKKLIPMGRLANRDEYKGAIQFMISDASSYMNGANLVIDGGRTIW